jgi:hypothetical protein
MFIATHHAGFGASVRAGLGNSWSLDFSGAEQYGTATVGPGAGALTMLAWVFLDNVVSRPLIRFGTSADHLGSTGIMFDASGKLQYHQPGVFSLTTASAISTGAWSSLAVAAASGAASTSNPLFYQNGAVIGGTPALSGSGTPALSSSAMSIGKDGTNTDEFDGKIAMMAIWNAQLSASAIAEIHAAGAGAVLTSNFGNYTSSANLLYHWAIEEGTGTTLVDQKGAANITLVGSPTWSTSVP